MDLSNVKLIPAVIISTEDPKCLGRVKVVAPGVMNDKTMDPEYMPWVMPIGMNKYQNFSKPVSGAKVWLVNNEDNMNEFWYFPYFEPIVPTQDFISAHYTENCEVIMSRNAGPGVVQMTYCDSEGMTFIVDESFLRVCSNGDVVAYHNTGTSVKVSTEMVKAGVESESYYNVIMGSLESGGGGLCEVIKNLNLAIQATKNLADGSPYTSHLSTGFQQMCDAISASNMEDCCSKHILVN